MNIRHTMVTLAGLGLLAAPAFAGPVWKFGPNDQAQMKLEYKGQFQYVMRDVGAEADGEGSTQEFNFRRNRLALMGAYSPMFGLYVQTEFLEDNNVGPLAVTDGDNSDFRVLDAVARFRARDELNVWAGKFKYGFSRENLESCEDPLSLDRSLFIRAPYVGTRDKGVSVWGNFADGLFQYRVDAMNGRSDSVSSPESNLRYSARAHLSVLDPENSYGYKGTYRGERKVLTLGAGYQMENDVAYANTVAQTGAVDYRAWTVDAFGEYPVAGVGTFTLSMAYTDYDLDEAYQGANPDDGTVNLNGEKNGYYVKGGYLLPNLPLQVFGRYEQWAFASLNGFTDQEVTWVGGGANYYFRNPNLTLTLEVAKTSFDKEGTVGGVTTEDFLTTIAQLQVVF